MQGYDLLTAHFKNNERTIVEVYWSNEKETLVEYIEAKEEDSMWQNLLEHISIDKLHENTYKHIKEQNAAFEETAVKIAKERGLIYDTLSDNTAALKVGVNAIFNNFDPEDQKDSLFVYKLHLFECDDIKNSKNKTKKSAIRKATTILEATLAACELIQAERSKK